jgi:hypothetical protein
VHGSDAGAGQHGVSQLRDHGEVDANPVAPADPVAQENVGDPAHVVFQLTVGDVLVDPGLVLHPDDGGTVTLGGEVTVHAVEGGIQPPARVPGKVHFVVVDIQDGLPGVKPGEGLGLLPPEPLGVVQGEAVEPLVLLQALDVGSGHDVGLDREHGFRHGASYSVQDGAGGSSWESVSTWARRF